MLSRRSWIALGIGAYLAFAIARFPASAAYRWFAPDELRLSGIEGTVWSGSAALGSVPGLSLRDLRWDLNAASLLLARIAGDIEARFADGFASGSVVATASRVELSSVTASTSLQTLSGLMPIYSIEGQISVNLSRLVLHDGWPVAATGEVRVGRLRAPSLAPAQGQSMIALGDFRAAFADADENDPLTAMLSDAGGPLELAGSIELRADRSYLLEGNVRARPGASEPLLQGLRFMTQEGEDGWRRFEVPGSL